MRRTLLDVVIGESAAILELLARKDEALLVRGDACMPPIAHVRFFVTFRRVSMRYVRTDAPGLQRQTLWTLPLFTVLSARDDRPRSADMMQLTVIVSKLSHIVGRTWSSWPHAPSLS